MPTVRDSMLDHRIRHRAFEIYEARQRDPALYDWLLAELEIEKGVQAFGCAKQTTSEEPVLSYDQA
jgi:hypothetical protein